MAAPSTDRVALLAATAASALAVAFQLAGKATRDALYLSTHDVTSLPRMVIAGALLSALLTIVLSRLMVRLGPGRLVPGLFLISALLLLAEWGLAARDLRTVAVLYYLHFSALGALLISGFWAIVTDRFDPRAARGTIGRITTGASVGGLIGGILPGRLGGELSLVGMLPLLALLHFAAGTLVLLLGRGGAPSDALESGPVVSPLRAFAGSSYLRGLALLIGLSAMAEGVLDWLFKAQTTAAGLDGTGLLRFFAAFYTITALIGIVLQATLLRRAIAWLGLARTSALLPAGVSLGALGGLLLPGLWPLLVARGMEIVLRSSFFRGAGELLFTPVLAREKRATKLLVDVGAARLGDVGGGALIQIALLLATGWVGGVLLVATLLLGLLALVVARSLHRGYATALARNLSLRADQVATSSDTEPSSVLQTVGGFDLSLFRERRAVRPGSADVAIAAPRPPDDRRAALKSGELAAVQAALAAGPLTPDLVGPAIQLLAWDRVAPEAIVVLATAAPGEMATLARHLLDPEEDFAIRRRLVRVLAECPTPASVTALTAALRDRRFEVRFRAGRALHRLTGGDARLGVDRELICTAILQEVAVGRGVWESRQLLDSVDDDAAPMGVELLRERADRSLEHVFTLLALLLPREPLRLAFQGLHTGDRHLRGTALEYLESVLPDSIRQRLWPFLEPEGRAPVASAGQADRAVERLLESRASIVLALDAMRRRGGGGPE